MSNGSGLTEWGDDFRNDAVPDFLPVDVPMIRDTLPDGREALIFGDVGPRGDVISRQGDNPEGFQGTCGLVSCANILREFGLDITEADVVRHARENVECNVDVTDRAACGGTTPETQARLLTDYGVPAHVESDESLEALAQHIEEGRGVIIGVDAGVLWDDASAWGFGQSNHAVTVRSVARDARSGDVIGFYIADSSRCAPDDAMRFVSAELMDACHLQTGGMCVVTDDVWPGPTPSATTTMGSVA